MRKIVFKIHLYRRIDFEFLQMWFAKRVAVKALYIEKKIRDIYI